MWASLPRVVMDLKMVRKDQREEVDQFWRILTRSWRGREGKAVAWEVRIRLPGRVLKGS
jgi:hypothetical protein